MTSRRQRTLEVNIVGDVRDLKRSLDQVENSTRTTSDKLGKAGKAIAFGFGAVASSAVLKVGADLNRLGQQAETTRNRFDVVFGDMAGSVESWADEVNERFGVSKLAVMGLAAEFQDLLVPLGFTRQAAAEMSQEALTVANALSEWTGGAIAVEDATDRIRKAMLGQREGLEALGVKILQSDLNARLAAKGQAELTGEAKAQAEAMATLEILIEKSADALTAYADGANAALIEQKALNAAVADGRQALGDFVKIEVDAAVRQVGGLAAVLEDLGFWLDHVKGETDASAESQRSWYERIIESDEGARNLLLVFQFARGKLAEWRGEVEANIPTTANYSHEVEQLTRHLRNTGDAGGTAAGGVDEVTQALKGLQDQQRSMVDPIFRLRQAEDKLGEAFEKRVRLQASGAPTSAVNDAIGDELQAVQDLDFARQNASDSLEAGFSVLERYAAELAIPTEAMRAFKEEVLGLDSALRGLPTSPFTGLTPPGGDGSVRDWNERLRRHGEQVVN